MPAGPWVMHDTLIQEMNAGDFDMDTDVFKIILLASTSNIAQTSVVALAAATNQIATGNGYIQNSKVIALTASEAAGVLTIDAANPVWNAAGGPITSRFAAIYNDTHVNKLILMHCLLDDTPADVTVTDGNPLTLNINAAGLMQVSRA